MVVLVNFLIVIIMFPPIIVFHEKYLIKNSCCQKKQKNVYSVESIVRSETCYEKFFGGIFNTGIRRLRWFIIIIFFGWTGYACYISKDIGPKSI